MGGIIVPGEENKPKGTGVPGAPRPCQWHTPIPVQFVFHGDEATGDNTMLVKRVYCPNCGMVQIFDTKLVEQLIKEEE